MLIFCGARIGSYYSMSKNFTSFRWLVCHLNLIKLPVTTTGPGFYTEKFATNNKMTFIEIGFQIKIMEIALRKILEQNFLIHTII